MVKMWFSGSRHGRNPTPAGLGALAALLALVGLLLAWAAPSSVAATIRPHAPDAVGAHARGGERAGQANVVVAARPQQRIDGFGFSEAFGQVQNIQALPASDQAAVAQLLFSRTHGAGLDIVRFGIGGAGTVADQRWLGEQALAYGVHTFYADSWSAPASMKTNDSMDNGGYLCGVPGATCPQGDQRQAYATLLAGQARDFARAGFPLQAIDPVNEPEFSAPYPSMLMTPAQAANFVPFLGRALQADGLNTQVACCDDEGWDYAAQHAQAVLSSPAAARYVGLITGHGYASPPTYPLTNQRPVWETEWSTFQPWDPAWDDGSTASGLTWANNIYTALTRADVNGFLYWWGASTSGEGGVDNEGLINISGGTYQPSGRLWAFAGFSRFVRPGAVRVQATSAVSGLLTVAFREGDRTVIAAINNNTTPVAMSARIKGGRGAGHATPYVTDASNSVAAQTPLSVRAGRFQATVPARALVTYVVTR
jgi:O-glycosyl hydrolase